MATMSGIVFPGDSTVNDVEADVPEPGHGQVLLQMKASAICGSDMSYVGGALVSCGFDTAYEGLLSLELSGQNTLLITGLGPTRPTRPIASPTEAPPAKSASSSTDPRRERLH